MINQPELSLPWTVCSDCWGHSKEWLGVTPSAPAHSSQALLLLQCTQPDLASSRPPTEPFRQVSDQNPWGFSLNWKVRS